jgi:hypothetical protein
MKVVQMEAAWSHDAEENFLPTELPDCKDSGLNKSIEHAMQ